MEKKYLDLKTRFEQLKTDLADPEIGRDLEKLKLLSREYSQLQEQVKYIDELEKAERQLAGTRQALADESDEELQAIAQEEIEGLEQLVSKLNTDLHKALVPPDPQNDRNAIVEIRAGTGGDEAGLFAANLFRMYSRYAERKGWRVKILSSNRNDLGGYKEVIAEIGGPGAFGNLRFESGVHRVQRIPETEKAGRVHTSTATVAVLPEAEEVDIQIKAEDLRIDVFRAGGHGGQSVNTTDSAVRITHLPTNTVVSCQDEKSQHQNKAKALQILRSRVMAAELERTSKERGDTRKSQIGTGERSEKIRTYNFPQDRMTDHRLKENWHGLDRLMDGDIGEVIGTLIAEANKIE